MSEIQIRTAKPEDARAIAAVLAASFLEYQSLYTAAGYAATTPDEATIRDRFHEGWTWVALLMGRIIGTVSVVRLADSLYIRSMAILPEARGNRLGERLLSEIERHAVAQGLQRLTLKTTPFLDRAIRLYENCGFVRCGYDDLFGTPLIKMAKELV